MTYFKLFNPDHALQDFREGDDAAAEAYGDRRDGKVYYYSDDIVLAVNVALVTGRPLLVQGPSGSGKSSVALNIARVMKRRYYEFVVTSRTQSQDLLWRFDTVRRLADAQIHDFPDGNRPDLSVHRYIEPGLLWWVYNRALAQRRGADEPLAPDDAPVDPCVYDPVLEHGDDNAGRSAVILIDEIDKADPDFPNNLLVALGSRRFTVSEIGKKIPLATDFDTDDSTPVEKIEAPLVIITTNGERRLPDAFLRRCVVLTLENPERERLLEIARAVEPPLEDTEYDLLLDGINKVLTRQKTDAVKPTISIAVFLDAVRAYSRLLKPTQDTAVLDDILSIIVDKTQNEGQRGLM